MSPPGKTNRQNKRLHSSMHAHQQGPRFKNPATPFDEAGLNHWTTEQYRNIELAHAYRQFNTLHELPCTSFVDKHTCHTIYIEAINQYIALTPTYSRKRFLVLATGGKSSTWWNIHPFIIQTEPISQSYLRTCSMGTNSGIWGKPNTFRCRVSWYTTCSTFCLNATKPYHNRCLLYGPLTLLELFWVRFTVFAWLQLRPKTINCCIGITKIGYVGGCLFFFFFFWVVVLFCFLFFLFFGFFFFLFFFFF